MQRSDKPDYDVLDHPEDEPIVLVGPPHALQGELRLHNPGDQKLVLRDARVRTEPARAAKAGLKAPPDFSLRRIVLRPGDLRRIPFNVALSPHTPPGEYHGQVEVGGRTREVVMHITEVVQLDISPSQLVIENYPGATIVKRVVFTNAGNVPLVLGDIGPVVLDETLLECRTGRAAIAAAGDRITGMDDYIAEVVRQTKVALEQTGLLRVHIPGGTLSLKPGDVHPTDVEIRVPDKVDPRARYLGVAAFYTSNLEFMLVPTHTARAKRGAKKSAA
jgi:hypothetical protein